jgi:lipoprotein LpqH
VAQGQRVFAVIGAALVAVGVASCSSPPQTAAASSAWVKINGVDAIRTDHVQCTQVQWLEMVDIGDNVAGARLFVDEAAATPNAKSVHIHNLVGFTGMYSEGDGGNADTTFTKERLTVTGTADGFNTHNPNQPATATFQVSVRC